MIPNSGIAPVRRSRQPAKEHLLYPYDYMLVFPRRTGGETRRYTFRRYNQERFVRKMLNLQKVTKPGETVEVSGVNRIFRSDRCYLNADGSKNRSVAQLQKQVQATDQSAIRDDIERERLQLLKAILRQEYVTLNSNSDEPCTQAKFDEIVCAAVAKRIQVACGLTTSMKVSIDEDEILCVVRADPVDLRVEADRQHYLVQLHNRPFLETANDYSNSTSHCSAPRFNEFFSKQNPDAYQKSVNLCKDRCDEGAFGFPMIDPGLFRKRWHLKLMKALKHNGHVEEQRGGGKPHGVYYAPFAPYQVKPEYQPFYRHYVAVDGSYTEFTPADRVRLVHDILHRHININALLQKGLVKHCFALHDMKVVKSLEAEWVVWSFNPFRLHQPLQKIRDYFGEKTALYFAFLQFYTRMLRWPSALGPLMFFLRHYLEWRYDATYAASILVVYSSLVGIWSTGMSELWRRQNSKLNLLWSTSDFVAAERERPQFHGRSRHSPITDKQEKYHFSRGKLFVKMFHSSILITCMIAISITATLLCLALKFYLACTSEDDSAGGSVAGVEFKCGMRSEPRMTHGSVFAGVVNGIQISVLNEVYNMVARILTDWENHRTNTEYDNQLIVKTFLFRFCNSYSSFFYIAFLKRAVEGKCLNDMPCIRGRRARDPACHRVPRTGHRVHEVMFIWTISYAGLSLTIIFGNIVEVAYPYFVYRTNLWLENKQKSKASKQGKAILGPRDMYEQPELEVKFKDYDAKDAFDDYAELVVQFGFVTLFVASFPLAPIAALFNNTFELRVDAYKLCFNRRRPFPHKAESIGMWSGYISILSTMSVIVNLAIICFTTDFLVGYTQLQKWGIFICAEHVLLVAKQLAQQFLQNLSSFVPTLRKRHEYLSARLFSTLPQLSGREEIAERLDLTLHPNDYAFGKTEEELEHELGHRNTLNFNSFVQRNSSGSMNYSPLSQQRHDTKDALALVQQHYTHADTDGRMDPPPAPQNYHNNNSLTGSGGKGETKMHQNTNRVQFGQTAQVQSQFRNRGSSFRGGNTHNVGSSGGRASSSAGSFPNKGGSDSHWIGTKNSHMEEVQRRFGANGRASTGQFKNEQGLDPKMAHSKMVV